MTFSITDIKGVSVGHASDFEGLTGVTVILTPSGMTVELILADLPRVQDRLMH